MLSDDELIKKMLDISSECRKHAYGMFSDVHSAAKAFESVLSKATDPQKAWIKDTYGAELLRIKNTILFIKELRSFHDKIFTKHFQYKRIIPLPITELFENFIKGITYFSNEIYDARPIYHRLYSCGPYEDSYRLGNLVCTDELDKKELARRRPLIERCYIERLIYDELWKKEALFFPSIGTQESSQDSGHMFRLELTKKDYNGCFPDTDISINIKYNDNMPVCLVITRKIGNGVTLLTYKKNVVITSYGHRLYEDLVECEKEVTTNNNTKTYFKVSTFDRPNRFSQVI